ncbi:MAG: sigma-70 family RNA polymerase sigma factor [Bacteroidota bacterium]
MGQDKEMGISDQDIIQAIRQGGTEKERMARRLFDQYVGWVGQAMKKHRLTEEEALDAYTDSILAGVRQLESGTFEGKSQVHTWLFQIFSNKCVDKIRRKTTHKSKLVQLWTSELPELSDAARNKLQEMIQTETLLQLKHLIHQLGEKCKHLIWDTEYWGIELKELAQKLGLKDARSASTQKYRCMEKLRVLIRKKMGTHV